MATTQTREAEVLESVPKQLLIGGEWRDAREGGTLAVEDPATGRDAVRGRRRARSTTRRRRSTPRPTAQAEWAEHPPRERGRDPAPRLRVADRARQRSSALLMTLEMGKPVAESEAEIAYAAEFFRWYAEEAVRIDGRYQVNQTGKGRVLTLKQPVGPVPVDHAVELPDGDGHAQDRAGGRRGLHHRHQAGQADAAVDAGAGADPRGGRAARRACSTSSPRRRPAR